MEEIIKLGEQMRKAQKDYFRCRDQRALREAKYLERKFDDAIKAYRSKNEPKQVELFNEKKEEK